jgi:hypothetical protein
MNQCILPTTLIISFLLFCLPHKRVAEKVTTNLPDGKAGEKIEPPLSHWPTHSQAVRFNFLRRSWTLGTLSEFSKLIVVSVVIRLGAIC